MNKGEIEMNIKPVCLILFISFFIFSSIGCISEHTPTTDVILNEEHQSQKFIVHNNAYGKLEWYFDDTLIEKDMGNGDPSILILNWHDLSEGKHKLMFDNDIETVSWNVTVIKPEGTQSETENIEEQFSWNDIRSEWKEKSDKLMNGEEK